jgi:hypothetical protein
VGKDTHALRTGFISVLEVLAANGVDVIVQENNGFTRRRRFPMRFWCTTKGGRWLTAS